jgi:cytoskeletal protein CcmA (bactofilin family)
MWNIKSNPGTSNSPAPELLSREPAQPTAHIAVPAGSQSSIGKGWVIKGEITGTESLFIDGCVEGTINLSGGLVTLGRNGQVMATISAGDIVVQGTVCGTVIASNRLEIRAEGAVTGNVAAPRLSIEDGAYFKGGVNTLHDEAEPEARSGSAAGATGTPKMRVVSRPKLEKLRMPPIPISA